MDSNSNCYKEAIHVLKPSAELSSLNLGSKVCVLQADILALIRNTKRKNFHMMQPSHHLLCRIRSGAWVYMGIDGTSLQKIDEAETALDFLEQSKRCCMRYGSQTK
mmetsp:Transcript_42065/g.88355  ORF Transcript_42065/g.88355 Transcript_42065/m.88355 type:complete len:106 (+) Transcript_42065:419-736(+)